MSLILPLVLLAFVGCDREQATANDWATGQLSGRLTITGSSTAAPLVAEIARQFEQLHPELRIDVQSGGSSRGIADTLSGIADLGMVSRELKPAELEQGLQAHAIAVDGVSVIVHTSRPVPSLTRDELAAIYRGQSKRWSDVDGGEGEFVVTNKAAGRATLEVFLDHVGLSPREIVADIVVGENQQAIKTVAGNKDAIGYVSIGEAAREIELGTPIRLVGAGDVAATRENVKNGLYPIARRLHLVAHGQPSPIAAAFLRFARSPAIAAAVEAAQFVPAS